MSRVELPRAHRLRFAFKVFLILTLLARGFFPASVALETDSATGAIVITLCGGPDGRQVLFDPQTGDVTELGDATGAAPSHTPKDSANGAQCSLCAPAFFAAASPALATLLIETNETRFGPPTRADMPEADQPARPPLPARGPPAQG